MRSVLAAQTPELSGLSLRLKTSRPGPELKAATLSKAKYFLNANHPLTRGSFCLTVAAKVESLKVPTRVPRALLTCTWPSRAGEYL